MGNTCKPMAVSFQCMKKSTTIKKNKNKKLKKKGKQLWLPVSQPRFSEKTPLSHHLCCLSQREGPLLSTMSLQSCIYGAHTGGALSQ